MKLFLFIFCWIGILKTIVISQTWDKNYYEQDVLYENSEILQLTSHERETIRQKIIEEILEKEFYDFNNNSNTKPIAYKKESQKKNQFNNDLVDFDNNNYSTKNRRISFEAMANKLNNSKNY